MSREIAKVNSEYDFTGRLSAPTSARIAPDKIVHAGTVIELRDTVTDADCGDYRQCWTRASDVPGCGARISIKKNNLIAECPSGTASPYIACANRVVKSIAKKL